MERLTERYEEYAANFPKELKGNRKEYPMNSGIIHEKLGYYEDLEEQGLLLKLPCKVGDTVYYTHSEHLDGKIEEYIVTGFCFDKQGCQIRTYNPKGVIIYFFLDFIGRSVFLTRAEAEEALRRMEKTDFSN